MSVSSRIQALIDCATCMPERDAAGVITAAGVDSAVRLKALNDCLKIAKEEETTHERD